MERLLVVFTRYPRAGAVKTRLVPALGAAAAARLHRVMTERTLARAAGAPPASAPAGAPAGCPGPSPRSWETLVRYEGGDPASMRSWLAAPQRLLPQGPGDLGQRLARAFAEGFAAGAGQIAAIGTDCPGLDAGDVADAFEVLDSRDAVFGPARDGGYWLVGLRRAAFDAAARPLFSGLPWGGADVLAASRAAAAGAGLSVGLLRTLADVDRPEDLALWDRALRGDAAGATICVVVPALNEAQRIAALVAALAEAAGVEVIVADGGSVDRTRELAAAAGARTVACGPGRALQMNAGAAASRGEILLFLHADTRLPAGWPDAVRSCLNQRGTAGGAFAFGTDSPRLRLRLIEAAANWRARALGIVFGDQAIFTRRETFFSLGGFPEQPLMEDYELVRRLRSRGAVTLLAQRVETSARRWEARGPLRNSLRNAAITLAYLAGVSPARLALWYRAGRGAR